MLMSSDEAELTAAFVGLAIAEHGVDDVDATSGEGDQSLVVPFALASLAVVSRSWRRDRA